MGRTRSRGRGLGTWFVTTFLFLSSARRPAAFQEVRREPRVELTPAGPAGAVGTVLQAGEVAAEKSLGPGLSPASRRCPLLESRALGAGCRRLAPTPSAQQAGAGRRQPPTDATRPCP